MPGDATVMTTQWTSREEVEAALSTARKDTTAARAFVAYEIADEAVNQLSVRLGNAKAELRAAEEALVAAKQKLGLAREKIRDVLGFEVPMVKLSSGDRA